MIKRNVLYLADYTLTTKNNESYDSFVMVFDDNSYLHYLKTNYLELYYDNDWNEIEDVDFFDDYGEFDNFEERLPTRKDMQIIINKLFSGLQGTY